MKRTAFLTDISGLGNCSGVVNISILSAMGVECCLVPTAVLSAQTGFPDTYIYDFSDNMTPYIDSLKKINPHFDAIYIGFIANIRQAEIAEDFVKHFKTVNTVVITDPIMGDNGKRHGFFSDELCGRIAGLTKISDVITPNLTELCILSGADYSEITSLNGDEEFRAIYKLCSKFIGKNIDTVIVTGIETDSGEFVNLTADKLGYNTVTVKKFGGSYSGTGDIFTSIVCGGILNGENPHKVVEKASKFIGKVLENTHNEIPDRNFGIPYQKFLENLVK